MAGTPALQGWYVKNSHSKSLKPVIVDWVDAVADVRQKPSDLPTMKSIGFLYKKDKKKIILVNLSPVDFDITHCVSISIPIGIVKKITHL